MNGLVFDKFPVIGAEKIISFLKEKLSLEELDQMEKRVGYYCKISGPKNLSHRTQIKDLLRPVTPKAYFFDAYRTARYFDSNLYLDYVFGDVTEVPPTPSLVKSRPVDGDNENSVLLKLNHTRHFIRVFDSIKFKDKKNLLIGRGGVFQEHRYDFFKQYFDHPLTDLRQTNSTEGNPEWYGPKVSILDHLKYKFILSLEGNDVASNLKWIMSSNSIAVMPKPKFETWFMEGTLVGGKHYIEIRSDYSDLEEVLNYYLERPELCQEIIENAKKHTAQFFNKRNEKLCQLLVLEKYFKWCS